MYVRSFWDCAVPTDVSSFASMRHHSNLGFETSSAQRSFIASCILKMHCLWDPLYFHRQTQPNRLPLPNMDGLSPIADVETSFSTQHGELDLPDLDVSYSSSGTPRLPAQQHTIESEPLAYFRWDVWFSKGKGHLVVYVMQSGVSYNGRETADGVSGIATSEQLSQDSLQSLCTRAR